MKIISFVNRKGGVGKSTSIHSVGAGLVLQGKKVLIIDMDPQATLTVFSHIENFNGKIHEALLGDKRLSECITQTKLFDLVGADANLKSCADALNDYFDKEEKLKEAIQNDLINLDYDYILIDNPPQTGLLSNNSLIASTDIIIPCQCEYASYSGLRIMISEIEKLKSNFNLDLNILGVLPTMLDSRKKISKEAHEMIVKEYKTLTTIRTNSKLSEIGLEPKSIFEIDKYSNGAKDYAQVVQEVLNV